MEKLLVYEYIYTSILGQYTAEHTQYPISQVQPQLANLVATPSFTAPTRSFSMCSCPCYGTQGSRTLPPSIPAKCPPTGGGGGEWGMRGREGEGE